MAPSAISAAAGAIVKVNGTSTATAIVAVRPGKAPITVPATTPARASRRLSGDNAANRKSKLPMQCWRRLWLRCAYFLTMPISLASAS